MAKAMFNSKNEEYLKYREFVELCKAECNKNYTDLGLIKSEI